MSYFPTNKPLINITSTGTTNVIPGNIYVIRSPLVSINLDNLLASSDSITIYANGNNYQFTINLGVGGTLYCQPYGGTLVQSGTQIVITSGAYKVDIINVSPSPTSVVGIITISGSSAHL